MTTISFTVPGDPRAKARPRFVSTPGGGRSYSDQKTVSYERTVAWMAKQAGARPIAGPLEIEVTAYLRIPASKTKRERAEMALGIVRPDKRPDADNLLKAIADGLNGIAYHDDAQLVDVHLRKFYAEEPRLDITIRPAVLAEAA